jgi:CBS domain-containing protein
LPNRTITGTIIQAGHVSGIRSASLFLPAGAGAMLDKLNVRDVYVSIDEYPHIDADAPIAEAFAVLNSALEAHTRYRSMLVHDNDGRLKGYLTMRDLIHAVADFQHGKPPAYKYYHPFEGIPEDFTALSLIWQEGFTLKIREETGKPVHQVMTLVEDTVSLDDPFGKCAYLMLARNVRMLPVVEADNQVLGVVRLVDLFQHIARAIRDL